jgi:lipopolysaccharide transport system ATP-binding protein
MTRPLDQAPDVATVLQAQGLGKRYRLYATPGARLAALLGWADRSRPHWALKDVSFSLQRGQCLGVVGDNGAGKSTLLKLLAGTLQASHGQLYRVGRITAILELGAGFHPDFTGRENLMFGGNLIGLDQTDMLGLADRIIEFSELGDAVDRPVKTYSSGMVVRLAFALVTAVQPEVLIIDEALAVGDQHFQKKCVQRMQDFRANGCTVLFCSHSLYHVRQLCDQVLWLNEGSVNALGDTEAVLAAYETHVRLQDVTPAALDLAAPVELVPHGNGTQADAPSVSSAPQRSSLQSVTIKGLRPATGTEPAPTLLGPDLCITVTAVTHGADLPSFGVLLEQYQGVGITSVAGHAGGALPTKVTSQDGWTTWTQTLIFTQLPLHSGQYTLGFYLFDHHGLVVYDEWKDHTRFTWVSPSRTPGLVRLPHQWS